jgi:tetratricopeptide (TPR) repeat protein
MRVLRFISTLLLSAALACAARPAGAADQKETLARELYQKALTHYDLAEYDRAVEEFKQAYELTNKPELLFNLAQAYRAKKDWANALHFYRTYLSRRPQAANRADVEAFIKEAELEAAKPVEKPNETVDKSNDKTVDKPNDKVDKPVDKPIDKIGDKANDKTVDNKVPPIVTPLSIVPPRPRFLRTWRGRWVLALSIASAATLVSAAVTGGLAVSKRGAYDSGCARGMCDDSLFTSGRALANATDALITIGVLEAATAVVLLLTRPRAPKPVMLGFRF